MCGLLLKCAGLIVMIHIFRALGRMAGPRFSGLALGLPSTTAIVLIFCGCEHGSLAATEMADSSLLGLAATVALPLGFIGSVRRGWPLWRAISASVGGYVVVAGGMCCLPTTGVLPKVCITATALVSAAIWVASRPAPARDGSTARLPLSQYRRLLIRIATPTIYVFMIAISERLAGPSWAGLVSTFPSLSLVVLIVTQLEAGPAETRRIAEVLPFGNTSTLAFLAVFRLVCADAGVGWGAVAGYGAAVATIVMIEGISNSLELGKPDRLGFYPSRALGRIIWRNPAEAPGWPRGLHVWLPLPQPRGTARDRIRRRLAHRCGFVPAVVNCSL